MKHTRPGGHTESSRKDKKFNIVGKGIRKASSASTGSGNTQQQKALSYTQAQHLSSSLSQRISLTQSQKISSSQKLPELSPAEKADRKAELAAKKRIIQICISAFIAIFIISVAIVLKTASEERSYQTYFQQAQECFDRADYENSLTNLRKAMSYSKTDESLLLMADCYLACGRMEKALEVLRTMDVNDPGIAAKISSIEKARQAAYAAQMVTVAGEQYPADAKSLVLDSKKLGNAVVKEVAQLYALHSLSLADNSISDISQLSALGGLAMLNLSDNDISDLSPISELTMLKTLYLNGNPIESFEPLYSLTGLTTLSLKNVNISDEQRSALSQALPGCAIHYDTSEKDVLEISFGGVSFDSQVKDIDLSDLGITDISVLASCTNLKSLDLSGNYISDLSPIMDIPGLERLNIENNRVTDLRPLMGMTSLTVINAENNEIESLAPLGNLTELTELYLSGNPIREFGALSKLRKLTTLSLENTGIDDEGLSCADGIESLRYLMLASNPMLTGNAVDEYKRNNERCLVYHDADMVYVIELGGKEYREDMLVVEAAYMGLTDISGLCGFDKAEKVNLSGNEITDIYCFQWMPKVRELDLSGNKISDITAISYLDELEILDLSNNEVQYLTPLYMLPNLKEVHLGGNRFDIYQMQDLQAYQPELIIYSD